VQINSSAKFQRDMSIERGVLPVPSSRRALRARLVPPIQLHPTGAVACGARTSASIRKMTRLEDPTEGSNKLNQLLVASRASGISRACTTDGAMIHRAAMHARRQEIERLQRRAAAEKRRLPFTFRAKRPFHPKRLFDAISSREGMVSKCSLEGIAWLASRGQEQALVKYPCAAFANPVKRGPAWWASIPESQWPEGLAEELEPLWTEPFGDRQTEVRVDVDTASPDGRRFRESLAFAQPQIRQALEACLLTDAEMEAEQRWHELEDPYLDLDEELPFSFASLNEGVHAAQSWAQCVPCSE
jgi:hypothetical protein